MPSLKAFVRAAGLPKTTRRWSEVVKHVKGTQKALDEAMQALAEGPPMTTTNGKAVIDVDWRAVAHNAPSRQMPRSVPWVHGLIRDAQGPSTRIELAPKRAKDDHFPVHLIMAHPDQAAAETMGWDDAVDLAVDGHVVSLYKSMGPAHGWCSPEPWALVAELDADHPLVVHAAEAAKGSQEAMDRAKDEFYAGARQWMDDNFPHPDFMNVVRSLMLSEWQHAPGYWPGDPLPDMVVICEKARTQLRG